MQKDLDTVCTALDSLAEAVLSAWSGDNTVCENWGWYGPAVTRHDLAALASSLATDIRSLNLEAIEGAPLKLARDLPKRLQILQAHTVPQMFGGNSGQAIPAYVSTLTLMRGQLLPQLGWQLIPDSKSLPSSLARRARAAQAELDQLTPNVGKLSEQIRQIQAAHAVADNLPIDLQALAEARDKLDKAASDSIAPAGKIKEARDQASEQLKATKDASEEAAKLVKLCEQAYQITTTKGLAGAFDQRANRLAWSMWTWVIGLVLALGIGSMIGAHRLEVLSAALQAPNPNWGGVTIQSILSFLSVGAPLWFAWLATKQIGQRFRLAEDYGFKASVAKAYEGYRKEAARIDPEFEARLFGSALTRLDEAPLRLVEAGSHGSPWHELANSEGVKRAFAAVPEFQERATSLLREAIAATTKVGSRHKEQGGESAAGPMS